MESLEADVVDDTDDREPSVGGAEEEGVSLDSFEEALEEDAIIIESFMEKSEERRGSLESFEKVLEKDIDCLESFAEEGTKGSLEVGGSIGMFRLYSGEVLK